MVVVMHRDGAAAVMMVAMTTVSTISMLSRW
jgi:hypothetical protein